MNSSDGVTEPLKKAPSGLSGLPYQEPQPRDTKSTAPVSDTRRWYVETLFAYVNQLMERTQVRCNYLILANSVAMVSFFTILNALLSNRSEGSHPFLSTAHALAAALGPSALFLASLVSAVTAFLPRIYEYDIELNQEFIASMPVEEYRRFVDEKHEEGAVTDFIEEIHVLSRILNDRTRRVDMAARLFIFGVGAMLIVAGLAAI